VAAPIAEVARTLTPAGFSAEALACAARLVLEGTPAAATWRCSPAGLRLLLALLSALLGTVPPTLQQLSAACVSSSSPSALLEVFDSIVVQSLDSLVRLRSHVHQVELAVMSDDVRGSSYVSLATRMAQLAHVLLRPVAGGGSSFQAASHLVQLHSAGASPAHTAHLAAGQRQLGAGLVANQDAIAGVQAAVEASHAATHSELKQLAAQEQQRHQERLLDWQQHMRDMAELLQRQQQQSQQQSQQQIQQMLQHSMAELLERQQQQQQQMLHREVQAKLQTLMTAQAVQLPHPPAAAPQPVAAPQPAAAPQPTAASAATVPQGYTFGAFPLQPGSPSSPSSPSSPLSRRTHGVGTASGASPSSRAGSRGSGGRPNPKAAGGQQRASPLAGGAQHGTSTPPQGRRQLQAPQGASPRVFDFLPAAQRDELLATRREQRLRSQGPAEGPAPQQGHNAAAGGSPFSPKLQYSNGLYQDDVTDVDMHG
jgi:hypothetical protein